MVLKLTLVISFMIELDQTVTLVVTREAIELS